MSRVLPEMLHDIESIPFLFSSFNPPKSLVIIIGVNESAGFIDTRSCRGFRQMIPEQEKIQWQTKKTDVSELQTLQTKQ